MSDSVFVSENERLVLSNLRVVNLGQVLADKARYGIDDVVSGNTLGVLEGLMLAWIIWKECVSASRVVSELRSAEESAAGLELGSHLGEQIVAQSLRNEFLFLRSQTSVDFGDHIFALLPEELLLANSSGVGGDLGNTSTERVAVASLVVDGAARPGTYDGGGLVQTSAWRLDFLLMVEFVVAGGELEGVEILERSKSQDSLVYSVVSGNIDDSSTFGRPSSEDLANSFEDSSSAEESSEEGTISESVGLGDASMGGNFTCADGSGCLESEALQARDVV